MGHGYAAKLLAWFLIVVLAGPATAQPAGPLPKKAEAIRQRAKALAPDAGISVIPFQGQEEFGRFRSSTDDSFTFYDIDRQTNVTLRYVEVRKLKNGYGGYNTVAHRHVDRSHSYIALAVVAAVIGGLLAAVATAKN